MNLGELRRLFSHYSGRGVRFVGHYSDWQAAVAATRGYAASDVLNRAIVANEKVRSGQAAYERDGVAFTAPDYPFPLIASLLQARMADERLVVADFGGGLASTYYQCRYYLKVVEHLKWAVIEQPSYAAWGRENLQSDALTFHDSVASATGLQPNVAVLSGVLQYLPNPEEIMVQLAEIPSVTTVIVDRTPFLADAGRPTELAVQEVPASVVASSYPAWLFDAESLLTPFLERGFAKEVEWQALDLPMGSLTRKVIFKGIVLKRCGNG